MVNKIKAAFILFLICSGFPAICEAQVGSQTVLTDTAHFYMKHSYDVQKYKLDLDIYHCYINSPTKDFVAKEVISIKVDSALNSIKLNAVNTSLAVDSVGMAGVAFTHFLDTLKIQLNRIYQPGELVDIRICYRHKNVTDQAFYAAGGYVFTDTPPEGARKWFPCWDRPSDKALVELTAKVPANVKLGSIGSLADSVLIADTLWYHWISRDPASTYLITISSRVSYSLDILYWHVPGSPDDSIPARFYFKSTENPAPAEQLIGPLTDFYSEKFGTYAFEKIGFATLNSYFPWGGMENQTMINLRANGWYASLIAHEFSHMWFGDLITCGTWADVWMNESFATYCESLWLENTTGYASYKEHLLSQAGYYLGHNPGSPIYNPDYAIQTPDPNTLYSTALVYDKGASVLHQLRYVLGDSLFFEVLHSYATDTNFMFGNIVTEDFVQKVNQVTGQDLNWFFDEWIYAPDHPEYQNTYEFQNSGKGIWNVKLRLKQIQEQTVFFRMPVEIKIVFTDQSDTLFRVINDVNDQLFEFTFGKEPESLVFDPNNNIMLKEGTTVVGIPVDEKLEGFRLDQNVPNPFKDNTRINYEVPKSSEVRITVYNSSGNLIDTLVDRKHLPGSYSVVFNGNSCPSGMYFFRMNSGAFDDTRRMILVK
jgi:aminopeptidase N